MESLTPQPRIQETSLRDERYRLLVDSVKDYAIFMLDAEGRVDTWNEGARRIKGYLSDEIVGRSISMFYTEEDKRAGRVGKLLAKAREDGRVEDEGWRVRKDGSRFWADVVISAVRDPTGQLTGYAKVTRDLTQRKETEDQIISLNEQLMAQVKELSALNNELESFSYSVSHDLRAPVRHMGSFAALLREHTGASLDETGNHYLNTIIKSAKRMGRLMDELLAFARIGRLAYEKVAVSIGALAEAAIAELKIETENRDIAWTLHPLPMAYGDPAMLGQVVTNLISNAVKYTRLKAHATIEIGVLPQTAFETTFFIRDNGAGFDMKYVGKLFGVFERLHDASEFEGTGIGLASAQRIINRHGGRIWAEGVPNQGATFYVSLPVESPKALNP